MDARLGRPYFPFQAAILVPLFSLSLFTSAALLFWVQPLIAKMFLPLLGGSPSVWNTCMVFFQALLLAGYAYVLVISRRISLKRQAFLHAVLLLVAGLVLPFGLSTRIITSVPAQSSPIPWLLLTLLITVGPPFFVLSATAPLLQRWFSHSPHKSASDPYFLYAVSNAGSMLALLAFPFLLEPIFAIKTQSRIWAVGYALLVALMICCALVLRDRGASASSIEMPADTPAEPVTNQQRLSWVFLAFVPSSLMLGVTSYIAIDVASVPLIWIIPLALYLTTFILAFSKNRILSLPVASFLLPAAILCLGAFQFLRPEVSVSVIIAIHLLVFWLIAFVCHRRLALSRPPVTSLAEFYLWIAVGGVLGGIFNGLIAPLVFTSSVEYPVAIVLGCLSRPEPKPVKGIKSWWRTIFPTLIFLLTFGLSYVVPRQHFSPRVESGLVLFLPLAICYVLSFRRPIIFGLALAALLIAAIPYMRVGDETLAVQRNFFGVWRVLVSSKENSRILMHGTTVHGMQFNDASRRCEATTYYHQDGPVGQIFEAYQGNARTPAVAAVGLGSGTIGTYSRANEKWDFYDIDPAIVRIASDPKYFTFLGDCTAAPYRVISGDARLRLAEASPAQYGLIVMDAFSSDSVPAHLLTTEAISLYFSKLSTEGLLAFHISNRYLDLEPLLSGLSRRAGLSSYIRYDDRPGVGGRFPAMWVVVARSDSTLGAIPNDARWRRLKGDIVWTDDSSNILRLLK